MAEGTPSRAREGWLARAGERARRWLVHPRWPLVVAAIAFVLVLPSLGLGHMVDDLMHAYVLRGGDVPGGPEPPWDLYTFADGGDGLRRGIDEGLFPWWTSPALKLSFLRPPSSVLVTFDHQVLGAHPWASHLLSCLVYAALVLLVAHLFRRLLPGAAGGLAALLFAVDDAHHFPVMWIANRHAVVSAALAVAALLVHLRARDPGARGRLGAWTGAALLALSLAAGESALGIVPYALAWAWWLDPGGRRAAVRALAPWGLVLAAWAAIYVAGGYGASGSGVYLDPSGQPLAFAAGVAERLPRLLLAQLFGPPADLAPLVPPEAATAAAVAGLVLLAAVAAGLWRGSRSDPAQRPLAAAMVLSLIPACAVFPSDRLLILSGIGAFGLIAIAIVRAGRTWRDRRSGDVAAPDAPRLPGLAFAALLLAVHLPIAALSMPVRIASTAQVFTAGIARGAATVPHDDGVRGKTLVVLVAADALMTQYMFLEHLAAGRPAPDTARILAVASRGEVSVEREGDRALVLRATHAVNGDVFSRLFRAGAYVAGERIDAGDLSIEVLEVGADGLPRALRARFARPIDTSTQRWIAWQGRGFVEVPILGPGERVTLPATDWFTAMAP